MVLMVAHSNIISCFNPKYDRHRVIEEQSQCWPNVIYEGGSKMAGLDLVVGLERGKSVSHRATLSTLQSSNKTGHPV